MNQSRIVSFSFRSFVFHLERQRRRPRRKDEFLEVTYRRSRSCRCNRACRRFFLRPLKELRILRLSSYSLPSNSRPCLCSRFSRRSPVLRSCSHPCLCSCFGPYKNALSCAYARLSWL